MHDELDVENGTEPKDGYGIHDDVPVNAPVEMNRRLERENGSILNNCKRQPRANRQQHDDYGQETCGVFCHGRPECHHCPGLVHQCGLHDHGEQQRQSIGGDAGMEDAGSNARKVICPELVKVAKGRAKVGKSQRHADNGDEQAEEVQDGGGAAQLGGWCEDEHDKERGNAGAELGAVVEDYANCFVGEGVDHGYRDLDGLVGRGVEGDVLGEGVEGFFW